MNTGMARPEPRGTGGNAAATRAVLAGSYESEALLCTHFWLHLPTSLLNLFLARPIASICAYDCAVSVAESLCVARGARIPVPDCFADGTAHGSSMLSEVRAVRVSRCSGCPGVRSPSPRRRRQFAPLSSTQWGCICAPRALRHESARATSPYEFAFGNALAKSDSTNAAYVIVRMVTLGLPS